MTPNTVVLYYKLPVDPMAKITKIEAVDKYCRIYAGDVFLCSLTPDTVFAHFLKEGMEVSPDFISNLISEDGGRRAVSSALNYISYCSRTVKQVRLNLQKKGFSERSIEHAVEKLSEYGYLNDENFAEIYAKSLSNKMGPRLAKAKLYSKGIEGDLLENATSTVAENQLESATILYEKLQRKYASIDEKKRRQKIYGALMRKGYEWGEISSLFDSYDD